MRKILALLIFILSQNYSSGQWTEQTTPPPHFNLFSFSFPSVNTGFAVGYGNTMIKTTNSGNSWYNISIFQNTAQDLQAVWFINENTGWMCSTNDSLYRTTNSGISWNTQMKFPGDGQKIFFINSSTGWILAQPNLYKTTNEGLNWNVINSSMGLYFTFVNENTGWMTTYSGGSSTIHKSTDGGMTWNAQYSTSNFRVIYSFAFVNESTGWAAGYREHILKTTNGGVTWIQQRDMNNSTGLFSMDFINENTGWAAGGSGYSLYTVDGGANWNQISLPAGRGNIKFLNSQTGWIVGSKIFKTTSSGLTYRNLQLKLLSEGFYNSLTNTVVSDTFTVYLKNANSPYENIDSSVSVINTQGMGDFRFFNAVNNVNFYLAVKHRNSVETWSSSPVSFSSGELNYDFTLSAAQAYGSNLVQVNSDPLRFAIYGGDVNRDRIIDASDLSIVENDAAAGIIGYVNSDVTGDEFVDAGDLSIVENNASSGISAVTP